MNYSTSTQINPRPPSPLRGGREADRVWSGLIDGEGSFSIIFLVKNKTLKLGCFAGGS